MRIIVIGAGPMGIEAALAGLERGYDVTVLEAEDIGASLRKWGATRFFSPLRMNLSARARRLLGPHPDDDALLTGPEMVDEVLRPLCGSDVLRDRVKTRHRVIAVGRRGLTRTDYAGHPMRAERPFRLLVATPAGEESLEADIVLDASGGYVMPLPYGPGGLPPRGEKEASHAVIRTLGDLSAEQPALRGKRLLVIGHGHSAANAIGVLEAASRGDDSLRVIWAVRSPNRRPCQEIAGDPLPERERVVSRANALAESPPRFLSVERRAMVDRVAPNNGHLVVTLTNGKTFEVDRIAAFTGYRPDNSSLSELALETSAVTEGGARLYRAISNITDCLTVPRLRREDLESGEPNFYFVGSRGYGRARSFLLQSGLAQLETIFEGLPR